MIDKLAIEQAKSSYRDGYNAGDIEKILSVFMPAFTDFSDRQPGFYGSEAPSALKKRLQELFSHYSVSLTVSIINVVVQGERATDYGWHQWRLTPKGGGPAIYSKQRYVTQWVKADGGWKIWLIITNREEPPRMEPFPESQVMEQLAAGA